MTTAEKLTRIAENEQKIYDKGKADGASDSVGDLWEAIQKGGVRTSYSYAFGGWIINMRPFFKPKYDIRPTSAFAMFISSEAIDDLPALCEECGIVFDFSQCTNFGSAFSSCSVTHIGVFDTTSSASIISVFNACGSLHTIDRLILKTDGSQTFNTSAFAACKNLENLTISGTIGNSNLSFSASTKLTAASLTSILTALSKDSTAASGKSITFATASKAVIEANDAATEQYNSALAAGWTIAFA